MAWTKFNDVTLTTGSRVVTINDNTPVEQIYAGYDLVKDGLVYELDTPSAGNLMLVDNWADATASNVSVKVRQTHAPLANLIHQAIQRLSDNSDTFESLGDVSNLTIADGITETELNKGAFLDVADGITETELNKAAFLDVTDGITGDKLKKGAFSDVASGQFFKTEKSAALFTAAGGLKTTQIFTISIDNTLVNFAANTTVVTPILSNATDYKIYAKSDATLEALDWDDPAPADSCWLGGFHAAYSDGTVVENSLWDLGWRPSCNPRAMTLSPDNRVWVDIYLMDVDYGLNFYSRADQTIADNENPPKIPAIYGGNGTTNYGSLMWYEAWDLCVAAGKRLPFYGEFTGFAYGVVERQAVGADSVTTKYQAGHRSACGVEQVTGVMYQWGANINGTSETGSVAWQDITDGRGDVYTHDTKAVLLGAHWNFGSYAGSRAAGWGNSPTSSYSSIGARGVCDHQIL